MKRQLLLELRRENPSNDFSYQANVETLLQNELLSDMSFGHGKYYAYLNKTKEMLDTDSQYRPTTKALRETFGEGRDCCCRGPVPLEAESN